MSLVGMVVRRVVFGGVIPGVVRFVVSRLCLDEQITTMLWQPCGGGDQVGCEREADPDEGANGSRRAGTAGRIVVRRKVVHGRAGMARDGWARARQHGSASGRKNVFQRAS